MKEKSHRAARRCYESGVETLQGTLTRRLDGYSLYSAQRFPGPRDFEADHRPVRPAASQFPRRRHAAESGRRSARADVATGQRDPRPSPSRQGGAPAPGSAAAARLRAGLWLRRLQRRRAAGRRPDPQAAARSRSARGRGLGVATDAVAVRERRGPGRPLSARDRAGRRRADLPPRAPRHGRAAYHDRSRCDRRPDPRPAGVRPLQRLLRHVVLSAPHCHGHVQHRADPTRRGRAAAAGDGGGDPRRPRALAPTVPQAPRALSARAAARPGRCGLRRRDAAGLPRRRRGGVRAGADRQSAAGQARPAAAGPGPSASRGHRGDGEAVWRDARCRPTLGSQAAHHHESRDALLSRPLAQGQSAVSGDEPAPPTGHGVHAPVLRTRRHGEPAERTAAGPGHGPDQLLAIRCQPTPPAVLRRGLRPVPGAAELGARHRRRVRSGLHAARAAGEDCRLGRALGATHRTAHAASLPVARHLARPRPGADRHLTRRSMMTVLAQGRRISPTRTTNSRAQSSGPVVVVALAVTPLAPSFRLLNFQPGARWSRLGLWWVRSRIVRARTRSPTDEPIMMMRPPGFMCLSAACVATSVPRTLMSITRSISSSVVSSKGFGKAVPALFTSTSSRPKVAMVFSTAPLTASTSAASAWIATAFPPLSSIALTTAEAALASFAYVMATLAPSAARRFAIAAPMPLEPPVMSATFSSNLDIGSPLL